MIDIITVKITLPITAFIAAAFITGCHSHSRQPGITQQQAFITSHYDNRQLTALPDLTKRDTSRFIYEIEIGADEPLTIAKKLSRTAGGIWIVIAPHPLDDVKRSVIYEKSVQEALVQMQKAGTPLVWDMSRGYMLMDFGSKDDLNRIMTQPPLKFTGIFLRGNTDQAMLSAFADFEHITIEADLDLLNRKAIVRTVLAKSSTSINENESYSRYLNDLNTKYGQRLGEPEFTAIGKMDLPELMHRLSQYYCGEFTCDSQGVWKLTSLTDQAKVAAKIKQIDNSLRKSVMTSSFSSRQNTQTDSLEITDELFIRTHISDEQRNNFESLGILGKASIPTLKSYLNIKQPHYLIAAIDTLSVIDDPEATRALSSFAKKVPAIPFDFGTIFIKSHALMRIANALSNHSKDESGDILYGLIRSEYTPESIKANAINILFTAGDITPFVRHAAKFDPQIWLNFDLEKLAPTPPNPQYYLAPPQRKIRAFATTKSKDGDDWGLFISNKCGDPNDLWLAHGRNGVWSTYLFTGVQFVSDNPHKSNIELLPGAGRLTVEGDKVTIMPPPQKRTYTLGQRASYYFDIDVLTAVTLAKTFTLSLRSLQLDSDNDGLTDLIENRIGTDPFKADTDGDGVVDSQDGNPLAGPSGNPDLSILQTVFSGIFGGDTSKAPIVVILDKPYWREFIGASGRVLCMTRDEYEKRIKHLSAFRLLDFTDPPNISINIKSGPMLLNDPHTKAEVHFYVVTDSTVSSEYFGTDLQSRSQGLIKSYVAYFDKKNSSWILRTIQHDESKSAEKVYKQYYPAG